MTWMTLCLTVVALACGSNDPEDDGVASTTEQNGNDSATGRRSLVIFFSRAGENWQVGNVERGNTAIMVDYARVTLRTLPITTTSLLGVLSGAASLPSSSAHSSRNMLAN